MISAIQVVTPSDIRKGERVRYTNGDETWDYLITEVSERDPDTGAVTVQVEPA